MLCLTWPLLQTRVLAHQPVGHTTMCLLHPSGLGNLGALFSVFLHRGITSLSTFDRLLHIGFPGPSAMTAQKPELTFSPSQKRNMFPGANRKTVMWSFISPSLVTQTRSIFFFYVTLQFLRKDSHDKFSVEFNSRKSFVSKMNLYAFCCPKSQTMRSSVVLFVSKLPENVEPNSLSKCCNLLNSGHSKHPLLLLCFLPSFFALSFSPSCLSLCPGLSLGSTSLSLGSSHRTSSLPASCAQ